MKRIVYMVVTSLSFLTVACAASGQIEGEPIYYVSPAGSDDNEGTSPESPWQTIDKLNSTDFSPGTSILFEGGQTFAGSLSFDANDAGTAAEPITVSSYGTGRATLDGQDTNGIYLYNTAGFDIENLILVGAGLETNTGAGINVYTDLPGDGKLEHLHIDTVEVSGFLEGGILIGGFNGETYGRGYRDVRITNTVSHDNGDSGIQLYGYFENDSASTLYAHEDVYIATTQVYDNRGKPNKGNNSGNGIVLGSVDGGVIEYCVAHDNGAGNDFEGGGPIGIWAYESNDITIQYSESYNNKTGTQKDGGGFDLDGGVTNSVMQYNYSHGNDGAGFLVAQFSGARPLDDNVVRYNVSVNDGRNADYAGIYLFAATGYEVTNLEVYNNTVFITPSDGGTPSAFKILEGFGSYNSVNLRNNLFVTTDGVPLVTNLGPDTVAFQNNAYWTSGAPAVFAWGEVSYSGLDVWRTATSQETLAGNPVGLFVNPQLADARAEPTLGDPEKLETLTAYQLQTGSPLINAGLNLTEQGLEVGSRDFYGTTLPQGTTFDIGAHEVLR